MSAIVCGKRSFFEDMDTAMSSPTSASAPAYKKFRCSSSTSPVRFTYSPPVQTSPVDQLKALFPDMEIKVYVTLLYGDSMLGLVFLLILGFVRSELFIICPPTQTPLPL